MTYVSTINSAVAGAAGLLAGLLTAQAAPAVDPISGGAGWVGAGLLGLVLAWLFFWYLPAKDKQLAEKDRQLAEMLEGKDRQISGLVETRDKIVQSLAVEYRASMADLATRYANQDKERREDFKVSLASVVNHCEKNQQLLAGLTTVVADIRPMIETWRSENRQRRGGGAS